MDSTKQKLRDRYHILHITIPEKHHNNVSSGSGPCKMNTDYATWMKI